MALAHVYVIYEPDGVRGIHDVCVYMFVSMWVGDVTAASVFLCSFEKD